MKNIIECGHYRCQKTADAYNLPDGWRWYFTARGIEIPNCGKHKDFIPHDVYLRQKQYF